MLIAAISDTHRSHIKDTDFLKAAAPDLILHAGDSDSCDENTTIRFINWLKKMSQLCPIVFTAGNHDEFVKYHEDEVREMIEGFNIQLLINEGITTGGLNIWGSPYSEVYGYNHNAYTLDDESLGKYIWKKIPENLDILITHTPAHGVFPVRGIGSKSLYQRIQEVKPRLHICGHIHQDVGHVFDPSADIEYINCAVIMGYNPVLIDYDVATRTVKSVRVTQEN